MHSFLSYFGILHGEIRKKRRVEKTCLRRSEKKSARKARKENQQPHGKVKAFAELVEGTEKT